MGETFHTSTALSGEPSPVVASVEVERGGGDVHNGCISNGDGEQGPFGVREDARITLETNGENWHEVGTSTYFVAGLGLRFFFLLPPSAEGCMHLEVSMRCVILLCHSAYNSLHVMGLANRYVKKNPCRILYGGGGGRRAGTTTMYTEHWNGTGVAIFTRPRG